MPDVNLGDFFTLKSHPFPQNSINILIGGDAMFTPPVMVAFEILNSSGDHNTDDGTKEANQVKGIFYSHKTHKCESHWFKMDEIKILQDNKPTGEKILTKGKTLQGLKSEFRNKQVILKSVDFELEKNKISQERRNAEALTLKRNPYLDFVPPVMTVIDVRAHETIKDNYHKTTGNKKRTYSVFEFKCKYYNPLSISYSEEWISTDYIIDITENFELGSAMALLEQYFIYPLRKPIHFEDNEMEQAATLIRMKEIVFYHYKYTFIGEDLWSPRSIKVGINEALDLEEIGLDQLLEKRKPNKAKKHLLTQVDFLKNGLYEISYLSDRGISTSRLIFVTDKFSIGKDENVDYLLVTNCLLRNGQIRNFKVSNIKSSRKVNKDVKGLFIHKSPPRRKA